MAKDPFDVALAGFQGWTRTTKRKLSADPVGEMETLLDLMRDYLEIEGPAELGEGDLTELLLRSKRPRADLGRYAQLAPSTKACSANPPLQDPADREIR